MVDVVFGFDAVYRLWLHGSADVADIQHRTGMPRHGRKDHEGHSRNAARHERSSLADADQGLVLPKTVD